MRLPIGISELERLIDDGYEFIDKSLFIKTIIDDSAQVILTTWPRRFGKSLNLDFDHFRESPHTPGQDF